MIYRGFHRVAMKMRLFRNVVQIRSPPKTLDEPADAVALGENITGADEGHAEGN